MRHRLAVLLVLSTILGGVGVHPTPAAAATPHADDGVLINELSNGGSRSDSDTFFELRNWGDRPVDLTGWSVYRCSAQGLRSNIGRTEGELAGVVLEPGELFVVSKVGMPGDDHISQPFPSDGFGLYLENPRGELVDGIGVYPNEPWPTQSECAADGNLPNVLAFAFDESWQRFGVTGDVAVDFRVEPATLGEQNASAAVKPVDSGVVISEFAPSGAGSVDDEFVELHNAGTTAVDISGWELYRCTANGRLRVNGLESTVPAGTTLGADEEWVFAANGYRGAADARYSTGLADVSAGVQVRSREGALVDRLAVSSYDDSACQGDEKLAARADWVASESYQRTDEGFIIAPRTPGSSNRTREWSVASHPFSYGAPGVAISEVATDPALADLPAGVEQRNFVELGNYGPSSVDIGGWSIRRCEFTGIRSREVQVTVPEGTRLAPGGTWLAAKEGTPIARVADASYSLALNMLGAGVWVADARGARVDSVGIYAANEMDAANVTWSPCTKGIALTTYQPDRYLAETFQRSRFTGVDVDDFVVREATPGAIDEIEWREPTARVATDVAVYPEAETDAESAAPGERARVLESWSGVSDEPLVAERGRRETRGTAVAAVDDRWGRPYQRFVLDARELRAGSTVTWSGSSTGRNEVQLSVWSGSSWRLLATGSGGPLHLSGELEASDIRGDRVMLLAQDGPRTEATLAPERDGAFENPADYDVAISHITDTQYLSESYPEVYSSVVSWIADNADTRKIGFATHTGDLVQNWVDPAQNEDRARLEFERASAAQGILDDAGVPNSVLPGNHDNKRGVSNDLFNEYFAPDRYADSPWYGGSIAPGDNSANFSTFTQGGARFLMLSLPYAYGEREIAWAESIVESHPDHNVVVSTHEHVTPKTEFEDARRSANSRWVSRAQQLWDLVIAPNRNVVIVLSGHFHGLGQLRTENAGDIEGHDVVELLADYQEFRTHTGERATGFQRLLQVDLASSTIAVDTFSMRLDATASFEYDYPQFTPDTGLSESRSNARPWRIVEAGLQGRYTADDDEFTATVGLQYAKRVATSGITVETPVAATRHEAGSGGYRYGEF